MVVKKSSSNLLTVTLDTLKHEGIIIIPCDTMYGIVGIAPETEDHIAKLKRRQREKGFLQLIADISWLDRFTDKEMPEVLRNYWPGPLTLIFPDRSEGTVALRVPAEEFLRELILTLDKPLFSTSVNSAGKKPLFRIAEIIRRYNDKVDLIIDSGDYLNSVPSTIVDISSSKMKVIRQGAIILP